MHGQLFDIRISLLCSSLVEFCKAKWSCKGDVPSWPAHLDTLH